MWLRPRTPIASRQTRGSGKNRPPALCRQNRLFLLVCCWKNSLHAVDHDDGQRLCFREADMNLSIAILCILMSLGSLAFAQGVSNQRDMYGNLVRSGGGTSSQTGVNQSTPNGNGAIRNAPVQQPINPTTPRPQQINRFGAGLN